MASLGGAANHRGEGPRRLDEKQQPEHQRDSDRYYESGRCSNQCQRRRVSCLVCVRRRRRRRRRRVWSLGSSVRRVASRRRRASNHTQVTHTNTVAHDIRVIACVCVCCMSAVAIKTRPAESLATLPACDRVCECCDVRVRVRACVYVSGRTSVRAGACAAGPGVNDGRRAMPKLYRTVCACVRVFSLFSYYYYYYSVVCGRDVRYGRPALSGVSVW